MNTDFPRGAYQKESRAHAIDPNSLIADFERYSFRHPQHSVLTRSVARRCAYRLNAKHTCSIDDASHLLRSALLNPVDRALLEHLLDLCAYRKPNPDGVDLDDFPIVGGKYVPAEAEWTGNTGEIGGVVDTTEFRDCLGHCALDLIFFRNIGFDGETLLSSSSGLEYA